MFVITMLMWATSVVLLMLGIYGCRHSAILTRDWKNLEQSRRQRTGRTMGTVIGGSALTYGERLRCPLVRFEAGGEECLAAGPVVKTITRGRKKELRGAVLRLTRPEIGYVNAHSNEFTRAIEAVRSTDRNGDGLRERWDLDYRDSVLSSIYPIGAEVAIAYDTDYPKSNCRVLNPDGTDGSLITKEYVILSWITAGTEIVGGIFILATAIGFLLNLIILA